MSTRPRRLAAKKVPIVIELSDSENETIASKDNDEYRPTETRSRIVDRAGATAASGV